MKTIILSLILVLLFGTAAFSETLTLEQCIERARNRNLDLKRGESDLTISNLKERQARYNYYPQINSGGDFDNRTWGNGSNLVETFHPLYFEMILPIYHFGEFEYKLSQSRANRFASLLNLLETNINLEKDITVAYLNVLKAKKIKGLAANMAAHARRQIIAASHMIDDGRKDRRAIDRWQVLADNFEEEQVKQENNLALTYTELRRLMEWENMTEELNVVPLEIVEEYEYDKAQLERMGQQYTEAQRQEKLFSYAASYSPAVRRRTFDVMAAENAVSIERAINMPRIDFAPCFKADDTPPLTKWQIGIRAQFSFLNLAAWENIGIRNEELRRTCIDRDIFYRDRKSQIRNAYYSFTISVRKLAIATSAVNKATSYIVKMVQLYQDGKATEVETIDAFNAYYGANMARINAIYEFFSQRQQMLALIGYSVIMQTPTVEEFYTKKEIEKDYSEKDIYYDYFFFDDMATAIEKNDIPKAEALLKKYRTIIGEHAFRQWSLIHFAAFFGKASVLEDRIRKGENVNLTSENGITPLYLACSQGHKDAVALLLSHGADPDIAGLFEHWTPLMKASKRNFYDICAMLLKKGAQVNIQSRLGFAALHNAVEEGYFPLVKLLVESGADVRLRTTSGWTALNIAEAEGFRDMAVYLYCIEKRIPYDPEKMSKPGSIKYQIENPEPEGQNPEIRKSPDQKPAPKK